MAQTAGDYLLERLRAGDTRHVFGYPGDGINGLLAAWGRADNQPRFIRARHEEMAAFEGAIHLLNGLYATSGPGASSTRCRR